MLIAFITDQHLGARNDDVQFNNYFKQFYTGCFFPYLKEHNIKQVIGLGDLFDRRKYVNFNTLQKVRSYYFDWYEENNVKKTCIIGNHDTFFKNTNSVNSPELLLSGYKNINIVSQPTEVEFDGTKMLLVPWICADNQELTMRMIEQTAATVLLGHLEISGFEMYRGSIIDHGLSRDIFTKFNAVFSGHFHHRSTRNNITYLGAPYEMTWSDYNDERGFHIFDTEDLSIKFIENPFKMFVKFHYDDSKTDTIEKILHEGDEYFQEKFQHKYVKIVITNKDNTFWYDNIVNKIEKAGALDIQVVDDHFNLDLEDDTQIINEAEDTLTILHKYIDTNNMKVEKGALEKLLRELYNEAININP